MAGKPTSQKVLEAFAVIGVALTIGVIVYVRIAENMNAKRRAEQEAPPVDPHTQGNPQAITNPYGMAIYTAEKSTLPPADPAQAAQVKVHRFRIDGVRDGGFTARFSDDARFMFRPRNFEEKSTSPGAIYELASGRKLSDLADPSERGVGKSNDSSAGKIISYSWNDFSFSPDGKRFAAVMSPSNDVSEQRINVWDTATGKHVAAHDDTVFSFNDLAFLDSNRLLCNVHAFAGQSFEVIDVARRSSSLLLPYAPLRNASDCDFAGDSLAYVTRYELAVHSLSRHETKTLKVLLEGLAVQGIRLSADGTKLAVTEAKEIRVYDTASGESRAFALPPNSFSNPERVIIPELPAIFGGGEDGLLRLYSLSERKVISVLAFPFRRTRLLASSRDSKRFVLIEPDGELVVFECAERLPLGTLEMETLAPKTLETKLKS